MSKFFRNVFVFIAAVLMLWACAVRPVKIEPIIDTGNPGEQVSRLDIEVGTARINQINVLAPVSFDMVEKNLGAAKDGLKSGDEISVILDNIAQAHAYLKRAGESAGLARTVLDKVIKAREDARAAGAPGLEKDYTDAEKRFLELTGAIENDNLMWAQKNQADVTEMFRSLEIRAIKEKTLGEVRDSIAMAEKEGAKRITPELYEETLKELNAIDAFISGNPYKKEEMRKRAEKALYNAQRLLQLTRQSNKFQAMKPADIALWTEEMLAQITVQLSAPDMRNQSFDTQKANILETIVALQPDRQFMAEKVKTQQAELDSMKKEHQAEIEILRSQHASEITKLTVQIAALEGKTKQEQAEKQRLEDERRATEARLAGEKQAAEQRLAEERQFNELYNEVQTFFEPAEAEVYKKGDKLVIRLRSIQFPIGKSIIMPENYSVLSKVQKAIRTFREPEVIIEGHTDSTGPTTVNELLSQQRAEAVRTYLAANQTVAPEKITAVGYGSVRPLASNADEEGRAINRRIDVIISPMAQTGR